MARGINKEELVPYILEEDRDLPEKERTIFYLRMQGALDNVILERELARTERIGRRGTNEIDVNKRKTFYRNWFLQSVEKVENWFPAGSNKPMNAGTDAEKIAVLEEMKSSWMTEIFEFTQGNTGSSDAEKKHLNSQHTSLSGKQTTTK